MRRTAFAGLLGIALIAFATCTAPAKSPGESPSAAVSVPATEASGSASPTEAEPTKTETSPAPKETSPGSIPPGSLALFATISGGTESESLKQDGVNVSWNTTHYKFLRYVPSAHVLEEFGWTSSKSYANSYIYGITSGDWVYVVRCSTDTGVKDITRVDPRTGKTVGSFGPVVTGDQYRGFTILGDRLIYRTKINKDLRGNRRDGGDVMTLEIGGTSPVKLLNYGDPNNIGKYYAIGDKLITIVSLYEGNVNTYDIYLVNPGTMVIGGLLYSFKSKDTITFHEGATALYWSQLDPDTRDTRIIRFPLAEKPVYHLTISETTPQLLTIAESQGKVLIVFRDDTPESPYYYLADLATKEIIKLEVDATFFSTLIYGNGQFCILN